ncbi:MAG: hypothetical protein CMJ77_11485 [Planctomycetaceae bacterium]|nr:hypothetical protein [Planctomycetaceae bacterium]
MQRNYWPPNRGRHIPYRLNQLTSLLSQIRGSRRSRFSKPSLRRGWAAVASDVWGPGVEIRCGLGRTEKMAGEPIR